MIERLLKGRYKDNQAALARALEMSSPALYDLRKGTNKASLTTARKIADLAGVPLAELTGLSADGGDGAADTPRVRAAKAARLLDIDTAAIDHVLNEVTDAREEREAPALYWFRKIETRAAIGPSLRGGEPKGPMATPRRAKR